MVADDQAKQQFQDPESSEEIKIFHIVRLQWPLLSHDKRISFPFKETKRTKLLIIARCMAWHIVIRMTRKYKDTNVNVISVQNKSESALALDYIPEGRFPRHTSALGNIQASPLNTKHKCTSMQNNPKLNEKVEINETSFKQSYLT